MTRPSILIAGVGNIFLGDDAFGVEVAQRLARRRWPQQVNVVDFGIRGFDLTFALMDGHDTVILVDAISRGAPPGTLYLIEPELAATEPASGPVLLDGHDLDPRKVLHAAMALGGSARRLLLVGCDLGPEPNHEGIGLSDPVEAAVEEAVDLVESLVARVLRGEPIHEQVQWNE